MARIFAYRRLVKAVRALPGGIETGLVVDDDPLVRCYVCQQVANFCYAVIECGDGRAALMALPWRQRRATYVLASRSCSHRATRAVRQAT